MVPLLVVFVLLFKLKLSSAIIVPLFVIVPPELNELVILAVPQFWKDPLKFKLPKIAEPVLVIIKLDVLPNDKLFMVTLVPQIFNVPPLKLKLTVILFPVTQTTFPLFTLTPEVLDVMVWVQPVLQSGLPALFKLVLPNLIPPKSIEIWLNLHRLPDLILNYQELFCE
jgi:hypothetical protein